MAKEKKPVKKKPSAPVKKKNAGTSFNINALLLAASIAVITFVSFYPSIKNDFINLDDPVYVTENPMVQSDKTQWKEIFTKPISLNYHPITMLTLAWNYQSAKKEGEKIDATVFHEWNIWIHVLNTLLVFYFIWLLSGKHLLTTAFTAAIFGIHPMHVESVAWVCERKDVLYTFFFLLSCISYLYYLDKKKILYLILSLAFYALSCLSKAMAVILPLVLILIDYFKARKWNWRILWEKIPFFLLSLYFGLKSYNIQATEAISKTEVFTLFQRIMFGSYGTIMYLSKFFAPVKLSLFYPYPTTSGTGAIPGVFYIAPIIWVVLGLLIWYGIKRYKPLSFGIAFFIVTVILVLQFLPVGSAIMADRYSYIPYIGIAFIIGSLINLLIKKYPATPVKILTYALCFIFVIFLTTQTYSRTNDVWKNSETVWTDVITNYPTVEIAYKNRGNYYGKELGDIQRSYRDYMVLKKMNSKDTKVYSNMGNVYGLRKQPDSALWAYSRAISLDPRNEEAYVNRGITYAMMGQYNKAIPDYNMAEALAGVSTNLLQNRAYTYFSAGKYQESLNDYNRLIQLKPNDGASYYFRGIDNEQLNNVQQALHDLQTSKALGYKIDEGVLQRVKVKAGQ